LTERRNYKATTDVTIDFSYHVLENNSKQISSRKITQSDFFSLLSAQTLCATSNRGNHTAQWEVKHRQTCKTKQATVNASTDLEKIHFRKTTPLLGKPRLSFNKQFHSDNLKEQSL